VWSCGVILYILLSGVPPFAGKTDDDIMNCVKKGQYSMSLPQFKEVSNEAKNLIKKMLEYNPEKRPSAKEALNDPWFKSVIKKDAGNINKEVMENLRKLNVIKD
jgi:calcium-dependent protein kinase